MRTSSIRFCTIGLLTFITSFSATCKFIDWPAGGGPGDPGTIYKTVKHVSTTRLRVPRHGITVAAANNKIYIAGGYTLDANYVRTYLNIIDIYDPQANTWSIDSMPRPRAIMGATTLDNKIYFSGGDTIRNGLDIYDAITGTWIQDTLPARMSGAPLSEGGGHQVLFVGGGEAYRNVYIYDSQIHSWSVHQTIDARVLGASVKADNELWFAGGYNDINTFPIINSIDIYDFSNQTWRRDHLKIPRTTFAAGRAGNQLLFAGGLTPAGGGSFQYLRTVEIYDLTTRKWRIDSLSNVKNNLKATALGNFILFAGGSSNGANPSGIIDVYNSATGKWSIDSLTIPGYVQGAAAGNKILFVGDYPTREAVETVVDIYEVK